MPNPFKPQLRLVMLPWVLALCLPWVALAQTEKIEIGLTQYESTLLASGAKRGDGLLTRLGPAELPAPLLLAPNNLSVKRVIAVDMLAFYYLGYRTTMVWLQGTERDGAEVEYQNSFVAKGRRVSGWSTSTPARFSNAFQSLQTMKATPIHEITPRPQQGSGAISGYQGDRTYNSTEPVPSSFAGYIGILTLLENGEVVHQMPLTVRDYVLTEGFEGRAPPPGRVPMALQGASASDMEAVVANSALDRALAAGDMAFIEKRITDRARANQALSDGWTPLMVAIANQRLKLAQWLLARGADVNALGLGGNSALLLAAKGGSLEAMKLLLKHKADPNIAPNDLGDTPLTAAIWTRKATPVELLLKAGANPNAVNAHGVAPLALLTDSFRGEVKTLKDMVLLMLKHGADPGYVNARMSCSTALKALQSSNAAAMEEVAPLIPESRQRVTACEAKRKADNEAFLANKDVNEAAAALEAAKTASRNLKDNAVMAAMRQKLPASAVSKVLLGAAPSDLGPNMAKDTALHMAMHDLQAYETLVTALIDSKTPLDSQNQYGVTALMLAAGEAQAQTVLALLKAGASMELKDRDGATALLFAVLAGKIDNVRALLAHGAKTNVTQRDGSTALTLAKQQRFHNIVQILEKTPQ
jgi:uncharacterized protein